MPLFWAAGIAAAGSIGSALISSNASNKAADATGAAAATATGEAARQFNISNANQQPWLTTGGSALQKLAGLYGLDSFTPPAPGSANGAPGSAGRPINPVTATSTGVGYSNNNAALTKILGGSISPGQSLLSNPIATGPIISNLFKKNSSPLQDIARAMSQGIPIKASDWAKAGLPSDGGDIGAQIHAAIFGGSAQQNPTLAQANPTIAPIQGQPGLTPGSAQPNVDPNADFYKSPDYQFRLSEGLKGLEARAATGAFGGLDSGALRKAEIGYAGNLASGDFNNYTNRLAALAGVGQTTATNEANQGATYASNVGNIAVNQGNNRASSYLANGQTYGNAVGGLAGIGAGLITNSSSYNPASGGNFNGAYMAPFNSAAAAAGY